MFKVTRLQLGIFLAERAEYFYKKRFDTKARDIYEVTYRVFRNNPVADVFLMKTSTARVLGIGTSRLKRGRRSQKKIFQRVPPVV